MTTSDAKYVAFIDELLASGLLDLAGEEDVDVMLAPQLVTLSGSLSPLNGVVAIDAADARTCALAQRLVLCKIDEAICPSVWWPKPAVDLHFHGSKSGTSHILGPLTWK